jgi:hypothetical protein
MEAAKDKLAHMAQHSSNALGGGLAALALVGLVGLTISTRKFREASIRLHARVKHQTERTKTGAQAITPEHPTPVQTKSALPLASSERVEELNGMLVANGLEPLNGKTFSFSPTAGSASSKIAQASL